MFKKLDFYTVAALLALIVGFCWVYITMVFLKIPGWPAMVGMAGYYAVGGLACHERCKSGPKSIKGLLLVFRIRQFGGVSKLVEIADGVSPGFDPPSLQAARSSDS
jgi:hypothetical protein